jgi:hypothetical protein
MANPISPVGSRDIFESARLQDEERRLREIQEHFERTGEMLIDPSPNDPLVPINGYTPPDIASDGDTYVENNPTQLQNTASSDDIREIMDGIFGRGYLENASENTSHQRALREQALKAEETRKLMEAQKERHELENLRQKSKEKFINAVSGLEVE